MRTVTLFIIALLAAAQPARAQFTLKAGDTVTFHFDALSFFQTMTPAQLTPGGQFVLVFDNATVGSDDSLRMEVFESSATDPAAQQLTLLGSNLPWVPLMTAPSAWADHEGAVRVTALSGSFTINELIMQRNDAASAGSIDIYQLRISAVPEPTAMTLAGLAGTLLAVRLGMGRQRRV